MPLDIENTKVKKIIVKDFTGNVLDSDLNKFILNGVTVFEKTTSSFLVAGTNAGLKYSEDNGLTWKNSNVTSGNHNSIVYSSKWNLWFSCYTSYIYTSQDGKTWTSMRIDGSYYNNDMVCDVNGDVYVSNNRYGYVYMYNGSSFTRVLSQQSYGIKIDTTTKIAYCLNYKLELYLLSNGIATKLRTVSVGRGEYFYRLINIVDGYIFYSSYEEFGEDDWDYWIWRCTVNGTDSPVTFSDTTDDNASYRYWKVDNNYIMLEGEDSYLPFYYATSITSNNYAYYSLGVSFNTLIPKNPIVKIGDFFYFCTPRYMYRATTLTGSRTRVLDLGGNYYVYSVVECNGNLLAITNRGIYVSTDGGASFTQKNSTSTNDIVKK